MVLLGALLLVLCLVLGAGIVLSNTEAITAEAFGVDQLRYFLLREVTFGQDGSYGVEAIVSTASGCGVEASWNAHSRPALST